MRGYSGLERISSACVRFADHEDGLELRASDIESLNQIGVKIAFVDYDDCQSGRDVVDRIAVQLQLKHRPYGKMYLTEYYDDLVGLSNTAAGLLIVVDNAQRWLNLTSKDCFEFIEAFLIQFEDWFTKSKPANLIFQIEECQNIHNALAFRVDI